MRTANEIEEYEKLARQKIIFNCKKCKGHDENCSCLKRYQIAVNAHEACVPRDFWNIKKKDITHNTKIFRSVVLKYVEQLNVALQRGYGLIFSGDNGVGKTFFISYVLMQAIRSGRSAYYTTMPQLTYNMKSSWNDQEISKRVQWMLTSDFVAIDELGKEQIGKGDDYSNMQIERILKQRCDDSLPVLLATNMDHSELLDVYGPTVGSILSGKFQTVVMEPGDFRAKMAKRMNKEMGYK